METSQLTSEQLFDVALHETNGRTIRLLYYDMSSCQSLEVGVRRLSTLLAPYSLGDVERLIQWLAASPAVVENAPSFDLRPHAEGALKIAPLIGGFYSGDGSYPDEIILTDRGDEVIAEEAWAALRKQNTPPVFFARKLSLVRLRRDTDTNRTVTEGVGQEEMLHRLRRVAKFVNVRTVKGAAGLSEKLTDAPAPLRIARDMLVDAVELETMPALRAIVHAPCVGKNGDLLLASGYHKSDQLYLDLEGLPPFAKPETTQQAAKEAFTRLFGPDGVFGEFPYAKDADRAHAAALLLTPFLRPFIDGNAPLAVVEAPEKGTGKSMLARNLLRVSDPVPASQDAPTARNKEDAEAEWSKVLATALKTGPSTLLFDNVRGTLASQALEQLLTSPDPWSTRLLGTGENVTAWPKFLTLVATSNNAEMSRDMARRCYIVRIDAGMETPENRDGFRIANLDTYVLEHRAALIADVVTILAAWIAAGRPLGSAVVGSFDRWGKVLSGILDFLDVPGFMSDAAERAAYLDPETAKFGAFFADWYDDQEKRRGLGEKDITVKAAQLVHFAAETEIIPDGFDKLAAAKLGNILKRNRDKVSGQFRLCARSAGGGILRWYLVKCDASGSFGDIGGGKSGAKPPKTGNSGASGANTLLYAAEKNGASSESISYGGVGGMPHLPHSAPLSPTISPAPNANRTSGEPGGVLRTAEEVFAVVCKKYPKKVSANEVGIRQGWVVSTPGGELTGYWDLSAVYHSGLPPCWESA